MSSDLSHSKFWSFDCPYIFRKAAYVTACWFPWIQTMKSRLLDCPRCHLFPFPLSFLSFSLLFCVYFLIFFFFFFLAILHSMQHGILVAWPEIEPMFSALEVWSHHHWTTREVPAHTTPPPPHEFLGLFWLPSSLISVLADISTYRQRKRMIGVKSPSITTSNDRKGLSAQRILRVNALIWDHTDKDVSSI